jgi:hypothetical protein
MAHAEFAGAMDELALALERALQLPEPPESWWHRAGVSPRAERWLEAVSSLVLGLLAVAWIWSIGEARLQRGPNDEPITPLTRSVTAALTKPEAPSTAYLTDAAIRALVPLRGASGKVQVVVRAPGDATSPLPPGATTTDSTADSTRSGIRQLAVRVGEVLRPVSDLSVITLKPLTARQKGRIGLYYIGYWPTERNRRAPPRGDYSPPHGLIEVTPQNQGTPLSEHLELRDFLTHDQQAIWPKYVVVQTRLIDKLELVLADLAAHGIPSDGIHVMSGFRTPQYNAGGGDPNGRAGLSRHMYGDAADVWIDNDGDGRMDDYNRDGRVDIRDAEMIRAAVDRVEEAHPELVGGCGVYSATSAHGPFTHIDARGYRARWVGTGDG